MPDRPRSEVFDPQQVGVYHGFNRLVQRRHLFRIRCAYRQGLQLPQNLGSQTAQEIGRGLRGLRYACRKRMIYSKFVVSRKNAFTKLQGRG